jgi:hypothetical protein
METTIVSVAVRGSASAHKNRHTVTAPHLTLGFLPDFLASSQKPTEHDFYVSASNEWHVVADVNIFARELTKADTHEFAKEFRLKLTIRGFSPNSQALGIQPFRASQAQSHTGTSTNATLSHPYDH